jgi:hypothetical protein
MLENADTWFLQIAVLVLSGYFLWSIRNLLHDFKNQIKDLNLTISRIFVRSDDHERRLSMLEGRCAVMHSGNGHTRGRRNYDPEERPNG